MTMPTCTHPNLEPDDWFAEWGTCPDCGHVEHNRLLEPGGSRHDEAIAECEYCQVGVKRATA